MAPLYFFYNLPPSESKEILQNMLDPVVSTKCKEEKLNTITSSTEPESSCAESPQPSDRCAIQ